MKPSLSRKPEAVAWSIEDLLEMARADRLRLPEFQRLFKWNAEDVRQLFDSIVRGFPIGTLLFWRRLNEDRQTGRPLESRVATSDDGGDRLWVLDGQQRLTSLAGTLLANGDPQDERFRIAYLLDTEDLVHVKAGEPWPERSLPLARAFDAMQLHAWVDAHRTELDDEARRRAFYVGKVIREFRVPAYIVVADDEETARLIYDRTNATGKKLTKAEVFAALHEGRRHQQPGDLDGVRKSLEDLRFGDLPDNLYLQAAVALVGGDVTKVNHETLADPRLGPVLPRVAAALRRTLVFLREDAHIPNEALLPYGFPLVALARFFDFYPEPRPRSRQLLARWVWRGAITQKHWTHEQANVRETIRRIVGRDEEAEVQALLPLVQGASRHVPVEPFSLHAASTRLYLLALLSLHPRDFDTGELMDGAELIAAHKSKAIPVLVEDAVSEPAETAARASIFNRLVHRPLSRTRMMNRLFGLTTPPGVLESHGLTSEDVAAMRSGATATFAARREARLLPVFTQFLAGRAQWDDSDRPSLAALVVEDD